LASASRASAARALAVRRRPSSGRGRHLHQEVLVLAVVHDLQEAVATASSGVR
jgi:5'-deoxynucleotidase YfbR-like HD superfamily hydrolase